MKGDERKRERREDTGEQVKRTGGQGNGEGGEGKKGEVKQR